MANEIIKIIEHILGNEMVHGALVGTMILYVIVSVLALGVIGVAFYGVIKAFKNFDK